MSVNRSRFVTDLRSSHSTHSRQMLFSWDLVGHLTSKLWISGIRLSRSRNCLALEAPISVCSSTLIHGEGTWPLAMR